jgi:hypothetical protein
MPRLIEVIGAEKYEQFKQWLTGEDPSDKQLLIGQSFAIASESFDYDMSIFCGAEQEYVGNAFFDALQTAQGEITDAVRVAVGRALVTVLASPHCDDYILCAGGEYKPEA